MCVRETYGSCVDEVKSPLGKGEWVGFVHGSQRGLEAHREAKTLTWGGDCWATHVSEVQHWIKKGSHVRGRLLGYTCEWNPTLNKDENNEWLI